MKKKSKTNPDLNEPVWDPNKTDEQLLPMLNWYSYYKNSDDLKNYFLDYLSIKNFNESFIKNVQKLPSWQLRKSGLFSRIIILAEDTIPKKYKEKLNILIEDFKKLDQEETQVVTSEEVTEKKKEISIQDRLQNQLFSYLGEIEGIIDEFVQSENLDFQYDFEKFYKSLDVKYNQAKNIANHYRTGLLKELEEALSGNDEQLVEGYEFLGKQGLKKFIIFVNKIIQSAEDWHDICKKISAINKKPRATKVKPPGKQVEKLKYLKEYEKFVSIFPSKIPGASQLWVYNVKYRTLGVYVCDNLHGFSVKGSTILNYDPAQSILKKLRKPDDIITKVLEEGKVSLRKLLPSLKAKEKKLTGRINKDTILLRVL